MPAEVSVEVPFVGCDSESAMARVGTRPRGLRARNCVSLW